MPLIKKINNNLLKKQPVNKEISTPSIVYLEKKIDDVNNELNNLSDTVSNLTNIKTINSDYTTTDSDVFILVDCSSNNVTITLTNKQNKYIVIKKIDSSSNTVTISPASGNIDGQDSIQISNQYDAYSLICDGNNWYIV